jgi:hypothetical protein
MASHSYLRIYLLLLFISLVAIIGINSFIDPLWFFSHSNRWNNYQTSFDERQQKTNRITFGEFDYDSLILGSSRTTYISQQDFPGIKAFNYAVSGMRPEEFIPYLEYAKKRHGKEFKTVIIGLDFFSTNRSLKWGQSDQPGHYIALANKPLYRFEALLSLDTLNKSRDNISNSKKTCDCYNRDNIKSMSIPNDEQKREIFSRELTEYSQNEYGSNYQYNSDIRLIYQNIRNDNPDTRFIVFTTPISQPLFELLVKQGKLPYLEKWLREMVEIFGTAYDFMGINTITKDLNNYQDTNHFYPSIGRLIAHRVMGYSDSPGDFGILINKDNIDSHILNIQQQANSLISSPN